MTWIHLLFAWLFAGAFIALFSAEGCAIFENVGEPGDLQLEITDAPADDVQRVRLTVDRVDFGDNDGNERSRDAEVTIDNLLDLQGGTTRTLLDDELPQGDYQWLRLHIDTDDSEVEQRDGSTFPLFTSATTNDAFTLRVDRPFRIDADEQHRLVVDIELRQALRVEPDNFLLAPVLRLVEPAEAGSVEGTVAQSLVEDDDCINDLAADEGRGIGNAVYTYRENNRTPGDIQVSNTGADLTTNTPLSTAAVRMDSSDGEYRYTAAFLPEGNYTLAFSCQALADRPALADTIGFGPLSNVTVEAGEVSQIDFN